MARSYERARYRDFYDLAMVLRTTAVDQKAVFNIFAQKEQRKLFSRETISANLEAAEESRIASAENLYYREEVSMAEMSDLTQVGWNESFDKPAESLRSMG